MKRSYINSTKYYIEIKVSKTQPSSYSPILTGDLERVPGEGVALVQTETDELTETVGVEDLRPEQVVQAVHQLEREVLQVDREGEQLPGTEWRTDYSPVQGSQI